MRRESPVLILAYNRPELVSGLISSLRPHRPKNLTVVIDGPKSHAKDGENNRKVIDAVEKIDWTENVNLVVRRQNLGIRLGIPDAVNLALSENDSTIVIEEDVRVGKDFFPFMNHMLEKFRSDPTVGHVGGYSRVPLEQLSNPSAIARRSKYPESYAWATWQRAWAHYDDNLDWALALTLRDLERITGSRTSAMAWWINFRDARSNRINTWAYRWTSSLWRQQLHCLTPNRNLVEYTGRKVGSHTRMGASWKELPVASVLNLEDELSSEIDVRADSWASKITFRGSPLGLLRRSAESLALRIL